MSILLNDEYELWLKNNQNSNYENWPNRYYMGLETSSEDEIKKDFKVPNSDKYKYD